MRPRPKVVMIVIKAILRALLMFEMPLDPKGFLGKVKTLPSKTDILPPVGQNALSTSGKEGGQKRRIGNGRPSVLTGQNALSTSENGGWTGDEGKKTRQEEHILHQTTTK